MGYYLLGLATLPALAVVVALVWVAVAAADVWLRGSGEESPERCHWGCRQTLARPGWTEQRWHWELRRRRAFAKHMRSSEPCRERANQWLANRGSSKRWSPRGFKAVGV